MSAPDTSSDTLITRDMSRAATLPLLCAAIAALSFHGVQIEDPSGYYESRFHSASFLMLPVFTVFGLFALWRLVVPWGPPIRLAPDGFTDRRAAPVTIPWTEITNSVRRGEYVVLTLSRRLAKDFPFSLTQRLVKARRKSAGPSHLLIAQWCLKTNATDLAELVSAYREAHSGGPANA